METLSLDLDQEKSACLIILLDTSIDTLKYHREVLLRVQALEVNKRPEELKDEDILNTRLKDNAQLSSDAIELIQEVAEILRELDSDDYKPKPLITKPFFSGE